MIELSADLGEANDETGWAVERAVWSMVEAANVACGGHAGNEATMRAAVRCAARLDVVLGAHPSYPDRENFGRRSVDMAADDLRESLIAQIRALRDVAAGEGVPLLRVKPHGALYNDAQRDRMLAQVIVEAMRAVDPRLAIVAPARSRMAETAVEAGTPLVREAFADRRYRPDGSLVPRLERDALLSVTEAAEQADTLAREHAVDARGHRLPIEFDTICIHADMEDAVARLQAIRRRIAPFTRV